MAVLYSPYFSHVLDAWSKRNHPNMHFMFFEDMKEVNLFIVPLSKLQKQVDNSSIICLYDRRI